MSTSFLYSLLLILFISCHQRPPNISSANKECSTKIKIVNASPPKITQVESNPPRIIPAIPSFSSVHTNGIPFFKHYSKENGLPRNTVQCSLVDSGGGLWFGTIGGGLSRFDGTNFTNYTILNGLSSNVIFCLLEDKNGNIWIGTSAGLCKYDGYRFINYSNILGGSNSYILCGQEDTNGNLWFGTQSGELIRYDGKQFSNYTDSIQLAGDFIQSMVIDRSGKLWMGTSKGMIYYLKNNTFSNLKLETEIKNSSIRCIFQDRAGDIWFGTQHGVQKYDGKKWKRISFGVNQTNGAVNSINEDAAGNIWMGTESNGIFKYENTGQPNFEKIGIESQAQNVTSISKDASGNLWFTTQGEGIYKFEDNKITDFKNWLDGKGCAIFNIIKDKEGNLWVATKEQGILKYDGKRIVKFGIEEGLPDNWIWGLLQDRKGNIWFGTNSGGLVKYDRKNFTIYTMQQGLANNSVLNIMEDKLGNIWVATIGGVSKFDGKQFTTYTTEQGLSANFVGNILQDNEDNIWMSTHDNGLNKFDGKKFIQYTTCQGLVSNSQYASFKDSKGNLWFGTNKGLSFFDGKKMIQIGGNINALNDIIWAIGEDVNRHIVWVGTNSGLVAIPNTSISEQGHSQEGIEVFNMQNGYPLRAINSDALFIEDSGAIWLGSEHDQLIRFDYPSISHKKESPEQLKIIEVQLNNAPILWSLVLKRNSLSQIADSLLVMNTMNTAFGNILNNHQLDSLYKEYKGIQIDTLSRGYLLPSHLRLPYFYNTISFQFTAINPPLSGEIKYQYLLENYSKNWSSPDAKTYASFGKIEPGKYTFKVRAISNSRVLGTTEYSFEVLMPWWRMWWMYLLYGTFIIIVFYKIFHLHRNSILRKQASRIQLMLEAQNEERSRIARDLHDEVGVKLSSIKLLLSHISEKADANDDSEIKSFSHKTGELINAAMRDVRLLLFNLSPAGLEEFGYLETIKDLIFQLNQFGQIRFKLYTFNIDKRFSVEYELAFYRITQEIINNAIKHADAKNVSIQIGIRDQTFILMIEDDGKGFDSKIKTWGNGLRNLKTRIDSMHGSMEVDSYLGRGTLISIEIPLHNNTI